MTGLLLESIQKWANQMTDVQEFLLCLHYRFNFFFDKPAYTD